LLNKRTLSFVALIMKRQGSFHEFSGFNEFFRIN